MVAHDAFGLAISAARRAGAETNVISQVADSSLKRASVNGKCARDTLE